VSVENSRINQKGRIGQKRQCPVENVLIPTLEQWCRPKTAVYQKWQYKPKSAMSTKNARVGQICQYQPKTAETAQSDIS
jgi:hypothetical protein